MNQVLDGAYNRGQAEDQIRFQQTSRYLEREKASQPTMSKDLLIKRVTFQFSGVSDIGPGGVFGQRPDTPDVDMVRRRNLFPGWAELGWLPVAGDGCGNYYVLVEDGTVGFVDTMKDPDRLDRQVASDLLSFMIELLAHDQEVDRTRN